MQYNEKAKVFSPKKQSTLLLPGVGQKMQSWHLQTPAQFWLSGMQSLELPPHFFLNHIVLIFSSQLAHLLLS